MTDYSELVNDLREYLTTRQISDLLEAQAKEIAELKEQLAEANAANLTFGNQSARIAELEAVLKPFAYDVAECFQDDEDTEITVKIRDIRAVRTALKGEK